MECPRALSLVVITLLQLCRGEIKNAQPQWYSANIINDNFQPKSISDLFSTEATFSTVNPIIVSSIGDYDVQLLSTSSPPTSLSSSTSFKTSTSVFPSSTPINELSSVSTTQPPLPQFSLTTPSSLPQYSSSPTPIQQYTQPDSQNQQTNEPSVVFQQQTSPADFKLIPVQPLLKMISEIQVPTQRSVQIQQDQSTSTQNLPQDSPMTTFFQPQPTETIIPQNVQYELVPQNIQPSIAPESSTGCPPAAQNNPLQPNYFLIYQQAPQSFQSNLDTRPPFQQTPQSFQRYPDARASSSRTTLREGTFTSTNAPPVTSTLPSTVYSPSPTFSSSSSIQTTIRTSPLEVSTNRPPSTQYIPPPSTQYMSPTSPKVTVTSLSTVGSSSRLTTESTGSSSTRIINCAQPRLTTPLPRANSRPAGLPIDRILPLKIRVVAPSGSITNIDFNPVVKAQPPPKPNKKRVARTTTTRKPKTRRTPKPRKNSYERCLQGCRKNGTPLCAAPLSQFPVDPKAVRGFPSVCHMACHNSYRKDAYEKVIDGSCSKLRTRIRPVDSDSKLKREELQKVQYFLDNSGQQPVFEFTGTYS